MATEADDRWYVQFDSQEVRLMTLDEIQEAFEAGEIHEKTYLIEVGASNWQTLADVAGLNEEDEQPEAEAAPEPAVAPAPVFAQAPVSAAPAQPRPVQAAQSFPPAAAPISASAAPQNAWPPVATARAPQSLAPSAPFSSGLNSTIPVVQDLDLDMSGASFKSGKRTALIAGLAAVVVLGGGGFALAKMDSQPAQAPVAAAPAPVQTTSPFKMDPVPSTPSTPSTPSPSSGSGSSDSKSDGASSSNKLSEDMKAALLASDKGKAAAKGAKASARTASSGRHAAASGGSKKSGGGGVFKAGGNDHDPLNSKL
jgi:hypothetical protein